MMRCKQLKIPYQNMLRYCTSNRLLVSCIALFIIAFGQAATLAIVSPLAATVGYGLFYVAISKSSAKWRFIFGSLFFTIVTCIQLRWMVTHPFLYIYFAIAALSLFVGLQFGITCIFASYERLQKTHTLLIIPSLWTLLEWSRLFILSGYTFNPTGLALTWNVIPLQCVQLFGIFGLTFFAMFTNVLFTRAVIISSWRSIYTFIGTACLPYVLGYMLFSYHTHARTQHDSTHLPIQALIVNINQLPEGIRQILDNTSTVQTQVLHENPLDKTKRMWEEIMQAVTPFRKHDLDLILLPEIVVPFASRSPLFSTTFFAELFEDIAARHFQEYAHSSQDIAKKLARQFDATVVIGLEDEVIEPGSRKQRATNSALIFTPEQSATYHKQVLVPLSEYIPCDWIKPFAAQYGIYDSWMRGVEHVNFPFSKGILSPSICYEETFGNIIRKSAQNATLLVNLTNDGWFPYSSLPEQHLELARLRAVENGLPLLRSCNFGISCAIDSLGQTVLEITDPSSISCADISLSTYTYKTLYRYFGDYAIVLIAFVLLGVGWKRQ